MKVFGSRAVIGNEIEWEFKLLGVIVISRKRIDRMVRADVIDYNGNLINNKLCSVDEFIAMIDRYEELEDMLHELLFEN